MKLVSIIMSVYNEDITWVKEAIDSILNQTYKKIELVIIVDNKENLLVINSLKKYVNKHSNIRFIINSENIGLANSLNKAFKFTNGEYVARMDADDIALEDRIMEQVKFMEENRDVDLVTTCCEFIDEDGNLIGKENTKNLSYKKIKKVLEEVNFLVHPSWIMRRELFIDLNGYRDFECSQDYDFLLRAIDNNFNIARINKILLQYRIRSNSISIDKGLKQHLLAKYIKYLHIQRKKLGKDSFSKEFINEMLSNKNLKYDKFKRGQYYFNLAKNENNVILKVINVIKCVTSSKYNREIVMSVIKTKILMKV